MSAGGTRDGGVVYLFMRRLTSAEKVTFVRVMRCEWGRTLTLWRGGRFAVGLLARSCHRGGE